MSDWYASKRFCFAIWSFVSVVNRKIIAEQASVMVILTETFDFLSAKVPLKVESDIQWTRVVKREHVPSDTFRKDFFQNFNNSSHEQSKGKSFSRSFGECATKAACWESFIDVSR
jgi:hypothetical protein